MNRYLNDGYEFSFKGVIGTYKIRNIIGRGSSCIVYLADFTDTNGIVTEHILKEYNPKHINLMRDESGRLFVKNEADTQQFKDGLMRFEKGMQKQLEFRKCDELKNFTSNVQKSYYDYGTLYIDMTVTNGKSYSIVQEKSMYDLMRRMKVLTQVIEIYHSKGYLHLDIKPDNIYVRPKNETCEDVLLFDFDSVTAKSDIVSNAVLSYTQQWAALEQIMSNRRRKICEATDVFAIGEIIFFKLMGRHSEITERSFMVDFSFDYSSPMFENVNPKVIPLLSELFRKTLSNSVSMRYQTTTELEEQLDKIIALCNPEMPYLKSSYPEPLDFFVGRDTEIADIHTKLQDTNLLFLSGIGGIGKSELAKQYAKKHCTDYDAVIFAPFINSVRALITNDSIFPIYNLSQYPAETDDEYYARKLRKLKELCDEKVLVIVDNFDNAETDTEMLTSLGCKLLITTRLDFSDLYACHRITALSDYSSILSIFNKYYTNPLNQTEMACVEKIIRYVNGHTMTVELLAKQMTAGRVKPEKMLKKLTSSGLRDSGKERVRNGKDSKALSASSYDHIRMLFDMSGLNEYEKYILANLALIPYTGISSERFVEWCELDSFDTVNTLVNQGWIGLAEKMDYISLHPVVADIILSPNMFGDLEIIPLLQNCIDDKIVNNITASERKSYADLLLGISSNIVKSGLEKACVAFFLTRSNCVYSGYGYIKEALSYCTEALNICLRLYGKNNLAVATILSELCKLYTEQEKYKEAEYCLHIAHNIILNLHNESPSLISSVNMQLHNLFEEQCDYKSAKKHAIAALKSDKNSAHTDCIYNAIGESMLSQGKYNTAKKYLEKALKKSLSKYGEQHLHISIIYSNLGTLYLNQKKYNRAKEFYVKAHNINKNIYGHNHPQVAYSYCKLGLFYMIQYDFLLAEKYLKKSFDIFMELFGEMHIETEFSCFNLGVLYKAMDNIPAAIHYFQMSYLIRENYYGSEHLETIYVKNILSKLDSLTK